MISSTIRINGVKTSLLFGTGHAPYRQGFPMPQSPASNPTAAATPSERNATADELGLGVEELGVEELGVEELGVEELGVPSLRYPKSNPVPLHVLAEVPRNSSAPSMTLDISNERGPPLWMYEHSLPCCWVH